ncbi:hypothetical protein FRC07_002234 [Ceratobasidium sp. 392]|nr:hypothetical protein FRC07_002234 [Ceratobasidium sp. 392]
MPPRTFIAPYLEILRGAVSRLPETIPTASVDDDIYQYFHNPTIHSHERTFQTFERAYAECFQPGPEGGLTRPNNVLRGDQGINLVISYLEANAKHPKMNSDELKRIALMVQQLVDLVHQRIHNAPKLMRVNSGGRKANRREETNTSSTVHTTRRGHVSDLHDADYVPGKDPESSGEELDVEAEKELGILGFGRAAGTELQVEPNEKESGLGRVELIDPSDAEDIDSVSPVPKPGRPPEKATINDAKIVNKNALPLSQKEFNTALTKAAVRDNHSMTFGEGEGMIQFFDLIMPGIQLPSHQTLQRHLYCIFDVLGEKVRSDLKAAYSFAPQVVERHAISTDAWTSKNSVYSLAAVILFFIDNGWRLHELVLDVVDLDAEHAGVIWPGDYYSDVKGSDVGELGLELEGKADYKDSRGLLSDNNNIEDTIDPELDAGSDSGDDNNMLFRLGLVPDAAQENAVNTEQNMKDTSNQSRWLETLNVAEKAHEIVVYVTASPKQRKGFHQIIQSTCSKDKRHLFVIRSMRMRWGSAYLEAKRAIKLRPAFTHLVANLDSNRPHNLSLKRARKLQERWTIRSEEWDLLTMLVEVLDPFHAATEAMSRKDMSTLPDVFPTFTLLERKLIDHAANLQHIPKGPEHISAQALSAGLEAGLLKLRKYQKLAQESDLCLIATS